mgnify:CR=1 FL=1
MVRSVEEALKNGTHLVMEAPTGIGKTVAVLAPSIEFAIDNDMKVLYLTRTNSQQEQVIKEAKQLRKFYDFNAVSVMGRRTYCLYLRDSKIVDINNEEITEMCNRLKRGVENSKICKYFINFQNHEYDLINRFESPATFDELIDISKEYDACPYEVMKRLSSRAHLIVMPYIYYFNDFINEIIVEWTNLELSKTIIIVDEAHNLPDFARDLRSERMTMKTIANAERELKTHGSDSIGNLNLIDFMGFLMETLNDLTADVVDDKRLNRDNFLDIIKRYIHDTDIFDIINLMEKYAENLKSFMIAKGEVPRSYVGRIAKFLEKMFIEENSDIFYIVGRDIGPYLEIFAVDPRPVTSKIERAYSSIHISGTLTPINDYVSTVFSKIKPGEKQFPSPFPKDNLKVYYVNDVTTRYEDIAINIDVLMKMADYISRIIRMNYNTLVLFPSYRIMDKIMEFDLQYSGEFYREKQNMSQTEFNDMIGRFRRKGGTIFSSFGGRIAEGMDFPNGQIEITIIAGIPYPKPSERMKIMEEYYEKEFDKNKVFNILYRSPASRKMRQALGRMIRSENDRGLGFILDRRAKKFSDYIKMTESKNVENEISKFFGVKI